MIPESVYNYVRFGSGAQPCATLVRDVEYTVKGYSSAPYVRARAYTAQGSRDVALSAIPVSMASQWIEYWLHEC